MDDQTTQNPTVPAGDQGGMPQAPIQPEPEVPVADPNAPVAPEVPVAPVSEPAAGMPSEQPAQDPNQGGQSTGGTL